MAEHGTGLGGGTCRSKRKRRFKISWGLASATVLKVESIALQVFCDFCVSLSVSAQLAVSEFKTFTVEDCCFVLIFKNSTNFASRGRTGLCVLCILLYGFIYFNCKSSGRFFPQVPFRICSAFLFCFVFPSLE